jgi:histone chaperone ASF1
MALINITNVEVKNSISQFTDPIVLDVTFECLAEIKSDITWKLIYIGKANDCSYDQVLEEIIMGPLTIGTMNFSFEAASPDWTKIPSD